jgi:hypothetical protein
MKRIEVRLNLDSIAPLLDVIRLVTVELEPELAVEVKLPEADRELQDGWESDLLAGQRSDLRQLLALFDKEFFSSGVILFDRENCEPMLRACAALRLRLRATQLEAVSDECLESGEIPFGTLSEDEIRAFATYVFLATLQEILIKNLDPNEPDDEPSEEDDESVS